MQDPSPRKLETGTNTLDIKTCSKFRAIDDKPGTSYTFKCIREALEPLNYTLLCILHSVLKQIRAETTKNKANPVCKCPEARGT